MSAYASYLLSFFIEKTLILMIGMLGVFVLTGLTGMFSMGQAAFMALGGYAAALLSKFMGFPMWINIIVALVLGTLFGFVIGLPAVKLRKDYVAIVSLGFSEALVAFLDNSSSITGGSLGISNVTKQTTQPMIVAFFIFFVFIIANFKRSRFGRQCLAIRSDELAAASMGINVPRVKLLVFMFAGAITAVAGALAVHTYTYIDTGSYGWVQSSTWIIMVFFGGINSLTGSIFAGILLSLMPELLRFNDSLRIVVYCIIVLIVVNFRPQGLFGTTEFNLATFKRWGRAIGKKKPAKTAEGGEK